MKFTITGELPRLNDYINAERRNKFIAAKIKKEATENVSWQVKKLQKITDPGLYTFTWYVKNLRTDPDNISFGQKFIFDGLQTANKLVNDNMKMVLGLDHRFVVDAKNPRVEVEVTPYE